MARLLTGLFNFLSRLATAVLFFGEFGESFAKPQLLERGS